MGEAYGIFALATVLLAAIAALINRSEKPSTGAMILAVLGAAVMAVYTWIGWEAHNRCEKEPRYEAAHPDYC